MPGVEERERIWHVQLHPTMTPLANDVNFRALAERFAVSGGDIKNAVLKAAAAAASESGPDVGKRIHQRHFERAMEDVVGNRSVMRQSVLDDALQRTDPAVQAVQAMEERWRMTALVAAGLAVVALLVAVGALGIVLGR
jgi:SpoVK/Ycf46/Vps4 family AAA+-type ATPase